MAKPTAAKLVELAAQLVSLAVEMTSQPQAEPADELLTEKQMLSVYGMGRNGADARGIPRARVGRSMKWRRADVEAAIHTAPPKPRPKKCAPIEGGVELDALLASGQVRR